MRLIDSDALMKRINKNAVTKEQKLIAKAMCDMIINGQTAEAKIDCSNIFNFMSEWQRRASSEEICGWVDATEWIFVDEKNLKDEVDELQKWSDQHPRQTRREKFINLCNDNELYRVCNPEYCRNGMPACVYDADGHKSCDYCMSYWSKEVD